MEEHKAKIFDGASKKINPGVAIIVILIAAIAFVILVWKSKKAEAPAETKNQKETVSGKNLTEESQVEDNTADWPDYKNYKYGYQIKFPRDWEVNDKNIADIMFLPTGLPDYVQSEKNPLAFEIKVIPVSQKHNIDNLLKNVLAKDSEGGRIINKEEVMVGGAKGYSVSHCGKFECWTGMWAVVNNGNFYFLNSKNGFMPQFNQIFSTFKFMDADQNTGEGQIGYLKSVYEQNGKKYLSIDYIQFLTGAEAEKDKRGSGECPKTGECIVENGYRIKNISKNIRTFEIAPDAVIEKTGVFEGISDGSGLYSITFDELKTGFEQNNNYFKDLPFWIELENDIVEKISQQYLP